MSANLVSNIFKVAEVIAKYKSKFFKDIPSSKRGKTFNSMPTELERATKLAAEILSEKDKDMGGAFCPSGITKDNRDIVQAISDGLLDLKDAIEEYEKKRWKLFGGNKVLPKVNELTDRISKFFYMFVSSTTSAGSPAMDLETILTDPKAIAFWRQNIERSFPDGRVKYPKFLELMEKAQLNVTALKLENMKPEEQSKMKKLQVTPFVLERATKLCTGWDEFLDRCGRVGEKNPIMAVVNTNNRASPSIVTSDSMPPAEAVLEKFNGQASFGSFYIMSTFGYVLTTMSETTDPGSELAVTIPGERPFQEWSLGKFSHIRHSSTKLCIGIRPGTSISVGCTPCIVEEEEGTKLQKWRIGADGTIRCAENTNLVLEISAEDIGKEFLRVSLRPYRQGAPEQMFMVVNYAPAFTPNIKRAHIPTPGDSVPYSPTPYSDSSIELLYRSYPQGQQQQQGYQPQSQYYS